MKKQKQFKKVPKHIAFIIDGNGRWAKKRKLDRSLGHKHGLDTLKGIIKECFDLGIQNVSVYAFSTENWNRPQKEVDYLFELFRNFLDNEVREYSKDNIKLNVMGDYTKFPDDLQKSISNEIERSKNNSKYILNLGLNYGGHDEIIMVTNKLNKLNLEEITKSDFESQLYTSGQPPVDFVVRTSGEQRISNFMLWQIAYSEFYFPKTFWPDFNIKKLYKSLKVYQGRNRRFGAIKE